MPFSATQPYQPSTGTSWWQRVQSSAAAWSPAAAAGGLQAQRAAKARIATPPAWRRPVATTVPEAVDRDEARVAAIGRAVHRVLEWASAEAVAEGVDLAHFAASAAREFGAPAAAVEQRARLILRSPRCARFFAGPQLAWSGNEVPVADAGDVLRIDRLVLLRDEAGPVWWVLDYKLHQAPESLPAYRDQLLRYRAAVQAAEAGMKVRCAFITGAGDAVEIRADG